MGDQVVRLGGPFCILACFRIQMAGRCNLKLVWAPRRGPALDANTSLISWSQHLDQRRRRREGGGGGIRRIRRSVRVVEGRFSKGRWANRRKRATSHCPREQPCAKPAIREPPWTRFALVNEIKGKKGFVGSEIPSTVLRFYGSGNSFFFFFLLRTRDCYSRWFSMGGR